ncbi:hypothetical protein Y1Q_0018990 [Alligator mississippiensis]|uniref:Uncharacterized protein n=1 Tax=Alligator mississippiensis TaxID=8496 RepID=A0A151M3K7_ALLMI|nr:hypothetical protein Y1Q_0018990 [Alligator mississippiensis]
MTSWRKSDKQVLAPKIEREEIHFLSRCCCFRRNYREQPGGTGGRDQVRKEGDCGKQRRRRQRRRAGLGQQC